MCDPVALTVASMALSAAGAGINSYESGQNERRQTSARNAAAEAEAIRQRRFADESQATFRRSVDEQSPEAAQQRVADAQTTGRQFMTETAAPAAVTGAPVQAGAPPIVRSEIARKVGQGIAQAGREGGRLADLTAYDTGGLGGRYAMARSNSALADTGSKAAGSAALLPLDLRAAENNAYRSPSGLGDILGIVGKGGTIAGAMGWNPASLFGGGAGAPANAGPTWGPYGVAGRRPY